MEFVDSLLKGLPGRRALLAAPTTIARHRCDLPRSRGRAAGTREPARRTRCARRRELEDANAALVRLKDAVWAVHRDRLRNTLAVGDLAGRDAGDAAIEVFASVQSRAVGARPARGARPRLGRASTCSCGTTASTSPRPRSLALLAERGADPLFGTGSVRVADGVLSFVYKAAAEIGELGDNTAALRGAIATTSCCASRSLARRPEATVLGAHPVGERRHHLRSRTRTRSTATSSGRRRAAPYVVAALNGDVDNYADLKAPRRCASRPRSPPTPR